MKFFSRWQPLVDEDAHTALVFGFMRHAPVKAMLEPWLTNLLGRHVTVDETLAPHDFWPNSRSLMEGRTRTEPDLVFAADDGRPLLIVVEVKPSFGQHYVEQIVREAVDTAGDRWPARLAVIMVGADLARPAETSGWQGELVTALRRHGHGHVEAELRYSSWALLGQRLRSSAVEAPEWRRYSDDVVHHLRLKGLLGYNGGPMFDDLEGGLTVVNAVELFNRTVKVARELLLAVHAQSPFRAAGYEPFVGSSHRMVRDGTSGTLTQAPESFEASVLLSTYRKPPWPDGAGVYIGVWLTPGEGADAHLQAGAFRAAVQQDLVWSYASAEDADRPADDDLARVDRTLLECVSVTDYTEWVYADQPWRGGRGEDDVEWLSTPSGQAPGRGTARPRELL